MARLRRAGARIIGTTRRIESVSESNLYLDLAADVSDWHCKQQIGATVICAGVTQQDACRRSSTETARVNVQAVLALAKNLVAAGAFVIYPSSNAVFDGTRPGRLSDERPSPVTEYGRQKAEVESQLLALGDSVSVVRFTKILESRVGLPASWANALANREVIHPFDDMVMSPVPLDFAGDVLVRLLEARLPGVLQVSGQTDVTYAEAARHIAERMDARPELVQPISYRAAGVPSEAAPAHTTLDTTRLRAELGIEPPDIWATIDSAAGLREMKGGRRV